MRRFTRFWRIAALTVAIGAGWPHPAAAQGKSAAGTLTDKRNGKTYKTTVIGNKRWMAENLNYQSETGNSWCYNDSDSYCEKYGRLYDLETATTACPAGWHLPSIQEWDNLMQAVGGKLECSEMCLWTGGIVRKLKAKSGWNSYDGKKGNGTDNYGFSALPGGFRDEDGLFNDAGYDGLWWTATENGSGNAYYRPYISDRVIEGWSDVNFGFSVRCCMD